MHTLDGELRMTLRTYIARLEVYEQTLRRLQQTDKELRAVSSRSRNLLERRVTSGGAVYLDGYVLKPRDDDWEYEEGVGPDDIRSCPLSIEVHKVVDLNGGEEEE